MRLNFIQNLSDQVVRQNHQLKAQLQQTRQQLKDYEWEMLDVIGAILPHPPIALTPNEIFLDFTRHVREELTEHRQLKQHAEHLREKYEALQKGQLESVNAISQLKLTLQKQEGEYAGQVERAAERERELQGELEWQRECARRLTEEMSEIKVEKMKLEEGKRRAIEDMRHTQNSMMVHFREKNEAEHMRVEKELRRELEMRDRTIKEMSQSLAALTDVTGLQNSHEVLANIFRSFQNYEQLSAANAELKQENSDIREEVKSLFNRIILLETELQEGKAAEHNVRSELERALIQQQDLERQLLVKMGEVARCERDKEAMQQYYDQKWNSEYKKVKGKLESTYNAKLAELQQEGQIRVTDFKATILDLIREKDEYSQQLLEITKRHRKSEEERRSLQSAICRLQESIADLTVTSMEKALMSAEEILTIRVLFHQAKTKLLTIISEREQTIKQQQEKMCIFQIKHYSEIAALHQKYESELRQQQAKFTIQKEAMVSKYITETTALQKQILNHIESARHIRTTVEQEFELKLQAEKSLRTKAVAQKEEEAACLNKRWIDKYCELESLLVLTRRKLEEEVSLTKNEVSTLLDSEYHLHEQRQTHTDQINCLELQVKTLEAQIQDKRTVISMKEGSIAAVKRELALTRNEVEVLLANRKEWKGELLDLQRDFTKEFDCIRKLSQKQVSMCRDKIHELEDLNRHKAQTRRELLKLQGITSERESFRSEIQLKETENIILHQAKDYYQARLRESEGQLARCDFKNTHSIMARRPKKKRLCNGDLPSQRALNSRVECKEVFEKRRYAISSAHKNYELSLSKGRLEESRRRVRVQTSTSLG